MSVTGLPSWSFRGAEKDLKQEIQQAFCTIRSLLVLVYEDRCTCYFIKDGIDSLFYFYF